MSKQYRTDAHTDEEIASAVEDLLSKMTLEEKLGQMTQSPGENVAAIGMEIESSPLSELVRKGRIGSQIFIADVKDTSKLIRKTQKVAVEETRLGIPMIFCQDVIHGYQTIFPIPLGWSCSWNTDLIRESQRVAAKEASTVGLNLAFSPMVDIAHDPRWGRVAEGAGEDPFLGSAIARAHVEGMQGSSLSDPNTVIACVKHYLGYGAAEAGRDYNTCEFSETALRNTYLPPFKAAVEAGVGSLMTAFNVINGVPAVANKHICDEILRKELGFTGMIISDYAAVDELISHGHAEDGKQAAKLSVDATLDIEMSTEHIINHGKTLIDEKEITQKQIDDAVRRILTYKYKLGLMEDPYKYIREDEYKVIFSEEHLKVSRELASKSIVLLKNDGVLPLQKSKKVAVIGPCGDTRDLCGPWQFTNFGDKVPTLVEGLKAKGVNVTYEKGTEILHEIQGGIDRSVAAAKGADIVILALGESSEMSGEAACKVDISITQPQQKLAEAIVATGKPTILVSTNGRPLVLTWYQEHVNAIVETWFLGSMAGHAIADVLLGDYNPSGKLSITFPRHQGQVPLYYNEYSTGRPCLVVDDTKYLSKYIDEINAPLYPFGYGLSYSSFKIENLHLSAQTISPSQTLKASIEVTNTGKYSGEETVQLYIRDVAASVVRPVKELKGFKKVVLAQNEKKVVEFDVTEPLLRFYNQENKLVSEPGLFKLWIGTSSDDKDLLGSEFRLTK